LKTSDLTSISHSIHSQSNPTMFITNNHAGGGGRDGFVHQQNNATIRVPTTNLPPSSSSSSLISGNSLRSQQKVKNPSNHALASLPTLIQSLRQEVCEACFKLVSDLFSSIDAEVKERKHPSKQTSGCRSRKVFTTKEAMKKILSVLHHGIYGNVRYTVLVFLRSYESCRRMLHLKKLNKMNASHPIHSHHDGLDRTVHTLYQHKEYDNEDNEDDGDDNEDHVYDENYDYGSFASKDSGEHMEVAGGKGSGSITPRSLTYQEEEEDGDTDGQSSKQPHSGQQRSTTLNTTKHLNTTRTRLQSSNIDENDNNEEGNEDEEDEEETHIELMSNKLNVLITESFCPLDLKIPLGKSLLTKRFSSLRQELRLQWLLRRRNVIYDNDGDEWSCHINISKKFRTEFTAIAKEEFIFQKKLAHKNDIKNKKNKNKKSSFSSSTLMNNKVNHSKVFNQAPTTNKHFIQTRAGTHIGGSGLNPNMVSSLASSIFNTPGIGKASKGGSTMVRDDSNYQQDTSASSLSQCYISDFYHHETDRIHSSRCAHCFEIDQKERNWRVELGLTVGGSVQHHFWKLVRKKVGHTLEAIERDIFQLIILVKFANRKSGLNLRPNEQMRKLLDDKIFELILVYTRRTLLSDKLIKESKDGTRIQFRTSAADDETTFANIGKVSFGASSRH